MADTVRFKHERNEAALLAAVLAFIFGAIGVVQGNVALSVLGVILLGVAFFAYWRFHGYPQLLITDDEVIYVDLSKRPGHRIPRKDLTSIWRYPKAVHFRNESAGTLLAVNKGVFSAAQLAEMARRLGIPIVERDTGGALPRKGRRRA